MPPWWSKSSCKEVKQNTHKRSFIDSIRKFKHRLGTGKFVGSERYNINISSKHETNFSVSALSSPQVSPCHSFNEQPQAQPLPHPRLRSAGAGHAAPDNDSTRFELLGCSKTSPNSPLCSHRYDLKHPHTQDAWGELATTSVSSNSSIDTNDQPGSQLLSLQASDYESGNVTAINSPSRHKAHPSIISRRITKDELKPYNVPCSNGIPVTSTERKPFGAQVTKLQITPRASLLSAPGSSTANPSRSPVKTSTREQVIESGSDLVTPCSSTNLVGSGRSCYLSSDQISGPHPATDVTLIWPQSRGSPEYSPISSPRITSPGRVYHRQSGGATPLHCSARFSIEMSTDRPDYGKPESHKLPLPPIPTPARYHGQPETSKSSVVHWKKGRLIGNGTFGQVFLSFNSDTGEMCAMKEVLLFSDDSKSKENSKQLEQEITLLSRLRHPNIVRYFGSEMVDDKLSIYLEYVSGGSINKILREYGALGESAIRSYTQQILAGLVYLHSKNTVHRDIKGANILVDPNGRVKLADFGMAKHITGHSCPFSFKGSPYWMAPEVIKNSSGCNLAVDIWSLGCTVIEMASTKPPWSQYEGVAALFKIGNSKEHPPTPDNLSEEGKDFVLRCLQRNPRDRPTAIQLLEHPFVRNAASPEKWMIISDPLEPYNTANNAERYRGNDHSKTISCLDLGVAVHFSRGLKNGSVSRNPHTSKHISCPVSPIGSPVLQPKASEPKFSSKSPTASSQTASGSSTSCTNRNVTFPINHLDQTLPYAHDVSGRSPRYYKRKPETLSGVPVASHVNGNITSCQSDLARSKPAQLFYEKPQGFCNRQAVLASRVSQQLLMDHLS